MRKLVILVFIGLFIFSCKTAEEKYKYDNYTAVLLRDKEKALTMIFTKGKAFNHPTLVVWAEDLQGNYLKTLFITKSYASGIYNYKMIGDSVWEKGSGPSIQPAALPYWSHKKSADNGIAIIPSPEQPFVDAYTSATPIRDFNFQTKNLDLDQFRLLVEVNQTWDWNAHWTNNKFPESKAYKHSAQPSLVYVDTINKDESEFLLKPIGHGDPTGNTGELFLDLSTLSTAKEIFFSIEVVTKH